ncbi:hypothetical protein FHU38_002960 [Saccharomonospora amisosensis]|uniref:Uncharacterized protein n=1 Tax=Saccharomonospora amisosensis TaxID=1128677 RepID=A0A7X5UR35_9PSEU|nr:hypothetical protein [Saccharomonospora amisosensis]NIJ12616.1 hypothetical protein [Saccharomonospora amisosensis]
MPAGQQPSPPSRPLREPIRKPWIWAGLIVILLLGIPWYLPAGVIEPVVLGLPLWTIVAIGSSILLCGYLTWVISAHWNMVEDEEEAAAADTGPVDEERGH